MNIQTPNSQFVDDFMQRFIRELPQADAGTCQLVAKLFGKYAHDLPKLTDRLDKKIQHPQIKQETIELVNSYLQSASKRPGESLEERPCKRVCKEELSCKPAVQDGQQSSQAKNAQEPKLQDKVWVALTPAELSAKIRTTTPAEFEQFILEAINCGLNDLMSLIIADCELDVMEACLRLGNFLRQIRSAELIIRSPELIKEWDIKNCSMQPQTCIQIKAFLGSQNLALVKSVWSCLFSKYLMNGYVHEFKALFKQHIEAYPNSLPEACCQMLCYHFEMLSLDQLLKMYNSADGDVLEWALIISRWVAVGSSYIAAEKLFEQINLDNLFACLSSQLSLPVVERVVVKLRDLLQQAKFHAKVSQEHLEKLIFHLSAFCLQYEKAAVLAKESLQYAQQAESLELITQLLQHAIQIYIKPSCTAKACFGKKLSKELLFKLVEQPLPCLQASSKMIKMQTVIFYTVLVRNFPEIHVDLGKKCLKPILEYLHADDPETLKYTVWFLFFFGWQKEFEQDLLACQALDLVEALLAHQDDKVLIAALNCFSSWLKAKGTIEECHHNGIQRLLNLLLHDSRVELQGCTAKSLRILLQANGFPKAMLSKAILDKLVQLAYSQNISVATYALKCLIEMGKLGFTQQIYETGILELIVKIFHMSADKELVKAACLCFAEGLATYGLTAENAKSYVDFKARLLESRHTKVVETGLWLLRNMAGTYQSHVNEACLHQIVKLLSHSNDKVASEACRVFAKICREPSNRHLPIMQAAINALKLGLESRQNEMLAALYIGSLDTLVLNHTALSEKIASAIPACISWLQSSDKASLIETNACFLDHLSANVNDQALLQACLTPELFLKLLGGKFKTRGEALIILLRLLRRDENIYAQQREEIVKLIYAALSTELSKKTPDERPDGKIVECALKCLSQLLTFKDTYIDASLKVQIGEALVSYLEEDLENLWLWHFCLHALLPILASELKLAKDPVGIVLALNNPRLSQFVFNTMEAILAEHGHLLVPLFKRQEPFALLLSQNGNPLAQVLMASVLKQAELLPFWQERLLTEGVDRAMWPIYRALVNNQSTAVRSLLQAMQLHTLEKEAFLKLLALMADMQGGLAPSPCLKVMPEPIFSSFYQPQIGDNLADVKLVLGENQLSCHKMILMAHSAYFEQEIVDEMPTISMPEMEFSSLRKAIQFCYAQKHLFAGLEEAFELLAVAKKLSIELLEEACLNYLSSQIGINKLDRLLELEQKSPSLALKAQLMTWLAINMAYLSAELKEYISMHWELFYLALKGHIHALEAFKLELPANWENLNS